MAEAGGHVVAETQGGQGGGDEDGEEKSETDDGDDGPQVRQFPTGHRSDGPEADLVGGAGVDEQHHRGAGGHQPAEGGSGEHEADGVVPGPAQAGGAQRQQAPRTGPENRHVGAEGGGRGAEHQGDHHREGGPRAHSEQARFGQRVAGGGLEQGSRDPQGQTDGDGDQRARQPQFQHGEPGIAVGAAQQGGQGTLRPDIARTQEQARHHRGQQNPGAGEQAAQEQCTQRHNRPSFQIQPR
ncbi:hypothetical protein SHIRM173S_07153 [Streptomyces hirsutus]